MSVENGAEVVNVGEKAAVAVGQKRVSPTEFVEAYLDGIKRTQTTGTFLVSYRGGRPIRIREVNELVAQR